MISSKKARKLRKTGSFFMQLAQKVKVIIQSCASFANFGCLKHRVELEVDWNMSVQQKGIQA